MVELLGLNGFVLFPPPDPVRRGFLPDYEPVVGGAAGILAGVNHKRAQVGNPGLASEDGLFVQGWSGEIMMDFVQIRDSDIEQLIVHCRLLDCP
jgi:hypothetical protein